MALELVHSVWVSGNGGAQIVLGAVESVLTGRVIYRYSVAPEPEFDRFTDPEVGELLALLAF